MSEVDYIFICLEYSVQAQERNIMVNGVYSDGRSTLLKTSYFTAVSACGHIHCF